MASILENSKHSSTWFDVDVVPEAYTLPKDFRPGNFDNKITYSVIDISKVYRSSADKEEIVQQVLKAGQEVGVFQVINHGVPEELIEETVSVMKEFFRLAAEEKVHPEDGSGWLYMSSTDFANNKGAYFWRENVKLPCYPLRDSIQRWPKKPARYREVVEAYLLEIAKLSSKLVELICEGLGLEGEDMKDVGEVQLVSSNMYPACPDPSVTRGLGQHKDSSLIILLYQGSTSGLQLLQHGEWINVQALPNAFLINVGNALEIISNGKMKSTVHRVVTKTEKSRLSIATFTNPSPNYILKPATALIDDESNPLLFKPTKYADYISGLDKAFGPNTQLLLPKPSS